MVDDVERKLVGDRNVVAGLRKDLEAAIAGLPERARTVLILLLKLNYIEVPVRYIMPYLQKM